jgi:hypothetical protein
MGLLAADDEVEAQPRTTEVDDARTLWVDTDAHGVRLKPWREVVYEAYTVPMTGLELYDIEGHMSILDLLRTFLRHGGDPDRWLEEFVRDHGMLKTDKTYHELSVHVRTLRVAGEYDQLNLGGNACFEVIARRVQAVMDAHSGGKVQWSAAKFFSGTMASGSASISPGLRHYVARRAREEREIENMRSRAGGRGVDTGGDDGTHAVGDGMTETPAAAGRGRGRGTKGAGRQRQVPPGAG